MFRPAGRTFHQPQKQTDPHQTREGAGFPVISGEARFAEIALRVPVGNSHQGDANKRAPHQFAGARSPDSRRVDIGFALRERSQQLTPVHQNQENPASKCFTRRHSARYGTLMISTLKTVIALPGIGPEPLAP